MASVLPRLAAIIRLVSAVLIRLWRITVDTGAKHLAFSYVIERHRYIGPWTRLDVLVCTVYFAMNVFCVTFRVPSWPEAGRRAAAMCLVNMIPLYIGPHVGYMADVIFVHRRIYIQIHRWAGIATLATASFHACVAFGSVKNQNIYSLIVRWRPSLPTHIC